MKNDLPPATETGSLQIMQLKRFWEKCNLKKAGKLSQEACADEWQTDVTLLSILGLGLAQTLQYVYFESPSFEAFERWITDVTGGPDPQKIAQFNSTVGGTQKVKDSSAEKPLLTADDHAFWDEHGYLIIKNAADKNDCEEVIEALCRFIGIDRYDSSTWYNDHPERNGIMVQLFQHPALDRNRQAYRIRKAFEEVWGRKDIWVNTDRVGFNPPETATRKFQGPRLHWDVSLQLPVPFGTQGILYLADTAENQGAFTLVPGFNNRLEDWIKNLPAGCNPRSQDLYALGPKPIAASAGDFIMWQHALPHGSSPNTSSLPRFVQYINYEPLDREISEVWI